MGLSTECAATFEALNANLAADLHPSNEIKRAFAKTFAMAYLRLARVWDIQAAALHEQIAKTPELTGAHGTSPARPSTSTAVTKLLTNPEPTPPDPEPSPCGASLQPALLPNQTTAEPGLALNLCIHEETTGEGGHVAGLLSR